MCSSTCDDASQKAVVEELIDVGNRLLTPPSAMDELITILENAERVLYKVWQQPPTCTKVALFPIMKAMISKEMLHSTDLHIQLVVASCFSEITRITAPNFPYTDEHMKEIFRLFMIAFKQLSLDSGRNYSRALQILETMAKLRSSMILIDMDSDPMVVEMFQLFLNTITYNHPSDIFKYMEMIMTLVIEESDEISLQLLSTLLASVRTENNNVSSISWELGNAVVKNCAAKLQIYLREAVNSMNLEIGDYADIITSLCEDTPRKNTVEKEVGSTDGISNLNGPSNIAPDDCTPHNTNVDENKLDHKNVLETLDSCQHIVPLKNYNEKNVMEIEVVDVDDRNQEKEIVGPLETGKEKMPIDIDASVDGENLSRSGQKKRKESMINLQHNLESSSNLSKILRAEEKNMPKNTGDSKGKDDFLSNEKIEDGNVPKKQASENAYKVLFKRLGRPQIDYGEELVNLRIKVWWPVDKTFYTGKVRSFDPSTKKHKIQYDDNEEETLNLDIETWELCHYDHPVQIQPCDSQEADLRDPAINPMEVFRKDYLMSKAMGRKKKELKQRSYKKNMLSHHLKDSK